MDEAAARAAGTKTGAETVEHPAGIEQALEALRFHWGDAYEIGHDDERGWWAKRRDGLGGDLTAAEPDQLHAAIVADYNLNPVSPDFRLGEE
jgi:hypothetical protein